MELEPVGKGVVSVSGVLEGFTKNDRCGIVLATNNRGDLVMAFHRDHLTRFLAKAGQPAAEDAKILQRAETAIAEFSDKDTGMFSGGKLGEVIGNSELVTKFDDMWERGQLHP